MTDKGDLVARYHTPVGVYDITTARNAGHFRVWTPATPSNGGRGYTIEAARKIIAREASDVCEREAEQLRRRLAVLDEFVRLVEDDTHYLASYLDRSSR